MLFRSVVSVTGSATTGSTSAAVTNPDAGTSTTANAFTVNIGPTIISPNSTSKQTIPNNTQATFSITGSNFASGSSVSFSGGFNTPSVTFVDASHLTVTVTAKNGNGNKGTFDLTVTNADGGSATSSGSMVNS